MIVVCRYCIVRAPDITFMMVFPYLRASGDAGNGQNPTLFSGNIVPCQNMSSQSAFITTVYGLEKTREEIMKKILALVLATTLAGVVVAPSANAETFIRVVSGTSGGSWYPLMAKLAQAFDEKIEDVSTSNSPGGGIGNIKSIHGGDADIGMSYAHSSFEGYTGAGQFDKKQEDIRHFATLYPAVLQIAVRDDSKIHSVSDMAGANISPGKPNWTAVGLVKTVLDVAGLSFEKIQANGGVVHNVSYSGSIALMKDRHADVFFAGNSIPHSSMIELSQSPGIRFIALTDDEQAKVLAANPGYIPTVIPKGSYKSVSEDVQTVGMVTNLIVHKDLPDDLVYKMCKVFWEAHADMVEVNKVWNSVKLENALKGAAIPLHPGAKKCYDEMGIKG